MGMRVGVRDAPRALSIALGLAVVAWLAVKASQDGSTFLQVTLNGITLAALFFVVSAGFTLIFGLMRVVNMAHGSLYLFGGYLAYTAQTPWYHISPTALTFNPVYVSVLSWVVPAIFATVVVGLVGLLIQQLFLRWNQ